MGTGTTAQDDDDTISDHETTTTDLDDIFGARLHSALWIESDLEDWYEEHPVGWLTVTELRRLDNITYVAQHANFLAESKPPG